MSDTATAEAGTESEAGSQAQVSVPKSKKAAAKSSTGNYIQDLAVELESLSKTKVLNRVDTLVKDVDTNYFELGGCLGIISRNDWHEGVDLHGKPYESFGDFVRERVGFEERKARYLIKIYDRLVVESIPWEKVQPLGWTKLKDLAAADVVDKDGTKKPLLTAQNVDEWVEKASNLTVAELQKLLKGDTDVEGEESETAPKTTDQVVVLKFKCHPDQAQTITQAINKARGEIPTKFESVALEAICLGSMSGQTELVKQEIDLVATLQSVGVDEALKAIDEAYPKLHFQMDPAAAEAIAAEEAAASSGEATEAATAAA